ncbi:MAG TPA: DTW domain-containing protein, partial [Oxalobacteraceae bacterium]|nr:DTW domain-containing protein [Oxalobacteraceae bacterium]
LRDIPPSRYLIRKAHKPHQISTLEATCLALMRLERNDERYLRLLTAFQGFVGQQAGYLPIAR